MKYVSVLLIIMSSIPSYSFMKCEGIFQLSNNSTSVPIDGLDKTSNLVSFRNILFRKIDDTKVLKNKSQTGVELKLPGDDAYSELRTFGNPIKVENQYYVRVRIDRVANSEKSQLKDADLLMPLRDLANLHDIFFSKQRTLILPENINNSFRGSAILKTYELITLNATTALIRDVESGFTKQVTRELLYHWNLSFRAVHRADLLDVLKSTGGQARILKLSKEVSKDDSYYFEIKKFPNFTLDLFFDKSAYDAALLLYNEGTQIFYTSSDSMHAGVMSEGNPISQIFAKLTKLPAKPVLAISRTADATIIAHELVHLQDLQNLKTCEDNLYRLSQEVSGNVVKEQDFAKLFIMINEQRAYAVQEKLLESYANIKTDIPAKPYHNSIGTYSQYAKEQIVENRDLFRELYALSSNAILEKLKMNDYATYTEVKIIINDNFKSSKSYSTKLLFPTHF